MEVYDLAHCCSTTALTLKSGSLIFISSHHALAGSHTSCTRPISAPIIIWASTALTLKYSSIALSPHFALGLEPDY